MSVTQATAQTNPSWWSQTGPSGEADPSSPDTGGTDSSLGFADFIDIINPLQHIPVISTLYRELTGDAISDTARMAGGAIWGGPAGLIGALANTITERETGGDIGATALAMARGDTPGPDADGGAPTALAAAPAETTEQPSATLAPLSDAVAQFAAAEPAIPPMPAAANAPQATAQAQEFSGTAASRLDAFIQRASAVRTADQVPARGSVSTVAGAEMTATAARMPSAPGRDGQAPEPATVARTARTETAPPLKLATDGNTDVAHWMMRALDRYETMKGSEQS